VMAEGIESTPRSRRSTRSSMRGSSGAR
jgi:hypothetical protein